MIRKDQIVPMLLQACPNFSTRFKEHRSWWKHDPPGIYNDIAEFAHYLVERYESHDKTELKSAFNMIEKLILEGDDEVRNIAVVGLLEDLQNTSSSRNYGPNVFIPYLKNQSLVAWQQLEELWRGKRSLTEVIRQETQETEE